MDSYDLMGIERAIGANAEAIDRMAEAMEVIAAALLQIAEKK